MTEAVGLPGYGDATVEQGSFHGLQHPQVGHGLPGGSGSWGRGFGHLATGDGVGSLMQEQIAPLGFRGVRPVLVYL